MENIVASRRLRKSMLKNVDMPTFSSLSDISVKEKRYIEHQPLIADGRTNESYLSNKTNFRNKILIKTFLAVFIVFTCLIAKLLFAEQCKSNKYTSLLINEYRKDYTKIGVAEKLEEISKQAYNSTKYIVPEKIANYISYNYVTNIKPKYVNFDLKFSVMGIFSKKNVEKETIQTNAVPNEIKGMGGGEPIEVFKIAQDSSSVSIMQDDIAKILSKKIDIKKPISGTITSTYGARDQIFDGVNSYHTGLDIANNTGTEIHSATKGKVVKVEENDKYYGNNIEIEIDGVIFKYAHMSKINAKKGDNVNQGDIIGLVGNTGMSTGPHLHFEIKIDSRSVDPQQLLKI